MTDFPKPLFDRLRGQPRDRLIAVALALGVEALLLLALLTLGIVDRQPPRKPGSLVSVAIAPPAPPAPEQAKPEPPRTARTVQVPSAVPVPAASVAPPVKPAVPPIIPLSRSQMAELDISNLPRQPAPGPARPVYGPVDTGVPGDSKRVGSAPNGEPMYAAAWYREPYDSELSGYLSTASGPGWALIACRTAPDFRVEDCVGLGEYPQGSQIERAVLAAAWQFKVRPPRVGGVSKIGEWVRIRIDYGIRGSR